MTAVLEVDGVSRRFGGVPAVDGVSLEVHSGEIVGLIGPNGAGKTTLMELISGLQRTNGGRIVFLGRDVTRAKAHKRAHLGIGRTFQVVKPLAGMSVLETVTVAAAFSRDHRRVRLGPARAAAREIIERVGLGRWADAYSTELPLAGTKRLELAKALALRPELLLLDEVMGGLNSAEVDELMALLREVRGQGVSLLVVEHVMKAVMGICDRVVVLHQGRTIAAGTPAEVTSDEAVIDAYLGARYRARRS